MAGGVCWPDLNLANQILGRSVPICWTFEMIDYTYCSINVHNIETSSYAKVPRDTANWSKVLKLTQWLNNSSAPTRTRSRMGIHMYILSVTVTMTNFELQRGNSCAWSRTLKVHWHWHDCKHRTWMFKFKFNLKFQLKLKISKWFPHMPRCMNLINLTFKLTLTACVTYYVPPVNWPYPFINIGT